MQHKLFGEWNPGSLQQLEVNVAGPLTAVRDGVLWVNLTGWEQEWADHSPCGENGHVTYCTTQYCTVY